MDVEHIYHMCRRDEWEVAQAQGRYRGSSQDRADGFIHFSAAEQVRGSAAKHRAGQTDLVLLVVATRALGPALRWEPSRKGMLFPHLYGDLELDAVVSAHPVQLGPDGVHILPLEMP